MNKIYIGNLPFQTTEQDLGAIFQKVGEIKELTLIKDRYTNECKGFAFITFVTAEAVQKALTLDGTDFQGRQMKVSMAKPEREHRNIGDGRDRRRSGGEYPGSRGGYGGGRNSSRDKRARRGR